MLARLRARKEWTLCVSLTTGGGALGWLWWTLVVLRGILPAVFAIAMGTLVGAVHGGRPLAAPLAIAGAVFVLLQVFGPLHTAVGANLGDRLACWLYDRLTDACVRPPGIRHLEDPELATDLVAARDFDLGITGPPMSINMDFIARGVAELIGGLACAVLLVGYHWWAGLLLAGGWLTTHILLRESAVWQDRNTTVVRAAQRDAEYAYRLAVDPAPAKEVRLFGLAGWILDRFVAQRSHLHRLQYEATRLREKPLLWGVLIVLAANVAVFWPLAADAASGRVSLTAAIVFAQAAVGTSMIGFGWLSWAIDGAAAPIVAVRRLEDATAPAGALTPGDRPAAGMPAREIRFRGVSFAYPGSPGSPGSSGSPGSTGSGSPGSTGSGSPGSAGSGSRVLDGFDLTIPAGSSLAIVGQNGAGKTTIAKLLCRLYDPQAGAIEIDGVDLRALSLDAWRARVTAVFQDFIKFELPLRDNVHPQQRGRRAGDQEESDLDGVIRGALEAAGAGNLASLDTILARGYDGGIDLSGGQWQRVALARALCAVTLGAGLVLLDEPTAQLDVRGESEIFERVLAATRRATTILISHRFSTVRHADRICVLERGRVVELGTHDELMALGGRYRTMFDLQAQRFTSAEDEGKVYETLE